MQQYIFVDIDGTLLDHEHGIPKSAVDAISTARRNGHKVFICTGRARSDISPFVESIGFDGYICASGAHVEVDGSLLLEAHLDTETVVNYMQLLDQKKIDYVLESRQGLYCSQGAYAFLNGLYQSFDENHPSDEAAMTRTHHLSLIGDYAPEICMINKISMFSQIKNLLKEVEASCPEGLRVLIYDKSLFGYHNGEIQLDHINKASGIQVILNHFGADQKDTMGLGDSLNDVEMIDFCHIGVAMGDAVDYLKEAADFVTLKVMEDGIHRAFTHYNLI